MINHLTKTVEPARMFMGRILAALSKTGGGESLIDYQIRKDLLWFERFLENFNRKKLMVEQTPPQVYIYADACTMGFGAHDHQEAYAFQISSLMQGYTSTQLECVNTLIALRTFTSGLPEGTHVQVACDNAPTIFGLDKGKAKDVVLAACARAAWYLAASRQLTVSYTHIPGEDMVLPDALSRLHLQNKYRHIAHYMMRKQHLKLIQPPTSHYDFSHFL